ncbi:PspC domain-containing protein [Flavobacterium faecale]|uniref:PspC domain-containing protein n=1 Tax=Flavobacterium faecale TaxID=1355330 RepID=UPI003AB04C8A
MNKTVNINLGGMVFHIDEDAYLKLTRYFDAIKRSLNTSSGQDEIIKDIEMRVAELFSENQTSTKQVVSLIDVDQMIAVMGQPEDYIIEDDSQPNYNNSQNNQTASKKLYRDSDNNMIGGVASGLGHYLGIDVVWIRVILVLLVIGGFGTGIIAYIILWVVTPEAQTTSEKLEMKGEPVNISNIEKKVREEFENVSNKIKNVDYDKFGNQIKKTSGKVGTNLTNIIHSIFQIFAKLLGIMLIIIGISTLITLLIGVFTLGSNLFIDLPWESFIEAGNFTDYPIWSFGLLMLFAIGIPFFFLTVLGFRLLSPKMKSMGNIVKYTLVALWIIALSLVIFIGLKQASAFSNEGRMIQHEKLDLKPNDTLLIKFKYNPFFANNPDDYSNFRITQDSANSKVIYSNAIQFEIKQTDEKKAYIQITREAKGKTTSEARKRAEAIRYNFSYINNELLLDNYFITDYENKFRDQEIEITLYLPTGSIFKVDDSVQNFDQSDNHFFNLHFSSDKYHYKMTDSKVKCLDCPLDENEYDDLASGSSSLTIDKDGISIIKDSTNPSNKELEVLKINKNGIIIKTK